MSELAEPSLGTIKGFTPNERAAINVPGSKSITNRALLIAALAEGQSVLRRPLFSEDTAAMRDCLNALGVTVDVTDAGDVIVVGTGALQEPSRELYVENAGTAARFLTAAAALVDGPVRLDGNSYMRKRPIGPLAEALTTLGCAVETSEGSMPVTVTGQAALANAAQRPIVEIDAGTSSQYVSAMMMIAPLLPKGLDLRLRGSSKIDAAGYLDVTLDTMAAFGVHPTQTEPGRWVFEHGHYTAQDYDIEPDYSGCTYFWAADQLCNTDVSIVGAKPSATRQPDAKSRDVMATFPQMPEVIDGAQMQDSVPTLAVLSAFNKTPVRFVGIANLRVKECDRIEAVAVGLNRISPGLAVVEGDDLTVRGGLEARSDAPAVKINSYDDHRIAMAFALVALRRPGLAISNPRCVEKTFPEYWTEFAKLGASLAFDER